MNALLHIQKTDYPGACFYVSTPRLMGGMGAHRRHTRFTADERALRENWHAMNLTEFWCPQPGPYQVADLYDLSARLCREAPNWDGTLDWPSPLHLARAIVSDHPGRYLEDDEGTTVAAAARAGARAVALLASHR